MRVQDDSQSKPILQEITLVVNIIEGQNSTKRGNWE